MRGQVIPQPGRYPGLWRDVHRLPKILQGRLGDTVRLGPEPIAEYHEPFLTFLDVVDARGEGFRVLELLRNRRRVPGALLPVGVDDGRSDLVLVENERGIDLFVGRFPRASYGDESKDGVIGRHGEPSSGIGGTSSFFLSLGSWCARL